MLGFIYKLCTPVNLLYTTSAICIKYRLAISKNPNVNSPEQGLHLDQHSPVFNRTAASVLTF